MMVIYRALVCLELLFVNICFVYSKKKKKKNSHEAVSRF